MGLGARLLLLMSSLLMSPWRRSVLRLGHILADSVLHTHTSSAARRKKTTCWLQVVVGPAKHCLFFAPPRQCLSVPSTISPLLNNCLPIAVL